MEEIKVMDINLEELHHSFEIKDETSGSEYQVDQVGETQICKEVKCGVCNVTFTDELQLASHIIVHTLTEELSRTIDPSKFSIKETASQNIVFACKMCEYNTYEQGSFELHIREHCEPKSYECKICKYKCKSSTILKYHMGIHSSEKLVTCKTFKFKSPEKSVGKSFSPKEEKSPEKSVGKSFSPQEEKSPEKSVGESFSPEKEKSPEKSILRDRLPTIGKKNLVCEICGSKFSTKQSFKGHLKVHPTVVVNVCTSGLCGYDTECRENLKACSEATHVSERVETGFLCECCGLMFKQRKHVYRHLISHTNRNKIYYACEYCSYKATSSSSLTTHTKIHTNEKKFICEICGYKCIVKASLTYHLRIHSDEKPFKCLICDYKTKTQRNLKIHLRVHTGEKPFECEICGKKYAKKQRCDEHLKTHTGEKPFMCEICGYKCISKCRLRDHLKIHTGEKFSCDICDFTAVRKYSVKIHYKTHMD